MHCFFNVSYMQKVDFHQVLVSLEMFFVYSQKVALVHGVTRVQW